MTQPPQQPYPPQHPQGGGQYQGGQYQGAQYQGAQYGAQPPAAHPEPQAYGNPPQYGDAPQYGNPPQYGAAGYQAPGGVGGVTPPPKKSGRGKLIAILGSIGGVILIGIVVVVIRVVLGNVAGDVELSQQVPEVGECITQASVISTETETDVVACDATNAAWQVLGNVGSYSETDFAATDAEVMCADHPETGYVLWIGELTTDGSGSGEVVCLLQVTPGG